VTVSGKILIVDDDEGSRSSLGEAMTREGYVITLASSGEEAVELGQGQEFDVVIADLRMKGIDGLQVVRAFKNSRPETVLIIMTGFASMETVVDAISAGAYDYISKPFRLDQMRLKVRQSMDQAKLLRENRYLRERVEDRDVQNLIVGSSVKMVEVFKAMAKVASSEANVLIQGESGTGKELVARSIHRLGPRKDKPFQAVNCTSVTESLLESELFGYVKGAFTDARESRAGFFQTADGGTIFLDEIGETSIAMQVKLLRVLQDKEVRMVGDSRARKVDVRIIAATNKDLPSLIQSRVFREELYYRINVVTIEVPPLRARGGDIPLLVRHFAEKFAGELAKTVPRFSERAMEAMRNYAWPGNARELENVIQRIVVMNDEQVIEVPDLPSFARFSVLRTTGVNRTLAEVEADHIRNVLANVDGNKTRAAEILGIDRKTLRKKIAQYGLD
jgi:DNA-binding NtrC family response regulator